VAASDHRHVPLRDYSADFIISGWSFCYLAGWSGERWWEEVARGLKEIERVLRPGGTVVILETLGTGHETPHRLENLVPYFDLLEAWGFGVTWIRTDYRFPSLQEAIELTGFFFGDDMAEQVRQRKWVVLPECTGIWQARKEQLDQQL
jgi:SAM-dependent methyltransferase